LSPAADASKLLPALAPSTPSEASARAFPSTAAASPDASLTKPASALARSLTAPLTLLVATPPRAAVESDPLAAAAPAKSALAVVPVSVVSTPTPTSSEASAEFTPAADAPPSETAVAAPSETAEDASTPALEAGASPAKAEAPESTEPDAAPPSLELTDSEPALAAEALTASAPALASPLASTRVCASIIGSIGSVDGVSEDCANAATDGSANTIVLTAPMSISLPGLIRFNMIISFVWVQRIADDIRFSANRADPIERRRRIALSPDDDDGRAPNTIPDYDGCKFPPTIRNDHLLLIYVPEKK
jgi:hypothetical protein